jgi:nitroreductase
MVRDYTDQALPAGAVEKILASALRAPSAGFSQGWGFLALTQEPDRARFWPLIPFMDQFPSMHKAPLIVVALSNKSVYLDRYAEADKGWTDRSESHWPVPYWDIDTGMAALLMLLSAVDEGLGACFIGIQPEQIPAFRAEFGVPEEYNPIGAVVVGYRAESSGPPGSGVTRRRREPGDVIHRGYWGGKG